MVSGLAVGVSATNSTGTGNGTLTFNISPKALTITGISVNSKVYDANSTATLSGTPVLNGVVAGDNVILSGTPTATYANPNVAATKAVTITGYTLSGPDASKYTLIQPSLNGSITVKPLTITGVTANDKVYDGLIGTTLSGTPVLNGVIGSDDVTIVPNSGSAKFADPNVGTNKPVTVTGYTLTGTAAGNYSVTNGQPTGLTASITKADQTITFPALPAKTTADADFSPGATASSGLTITYTSSNPSVATIVNGKIHTVGAGTTTITASQAGNSNYNAAPSVQQTFTVTLGVFEDFEADQKIGYAGGSVTLKSGTWYFDEALTGIQSGDKKNGSNAARIQTGGSIYMQFDIPNGAQSVSVLNANFGTDPASTWELQASTDGGLTWTTVGSSTSTNTLTKVIFPGLNFNGNVRFKILKTGGGQRVNFDDFDYVPQNVGTPVFTLGATSSRCQLAETVTYTATATNTTGITYSLDAASVSAGNSINATTGAVTYTSSWTGTSVITASAAGASGPKTATHTVTTRTQPTATISASSSSVCANDPSSVITFTGASGVAPYVFSYTINGGGVQTVSSTTGNTATVAVSTTPGNYTYSLVSVSGTYCSQSQSGSVSVFVKAAPALFTVQGGGSYCSSGGNSGTGSEIHLSGSETGVNYTLYKEGVSTGAVVSGTGAVVSFGNIKPAGNYTVKAVNTNTGCTQDMPGSAAIVVNSFPTAFAVGGSGTFCGSANVTLSGSQTNTFYQLINSGTNEGSDIPGTGSSLTIPVTTTGNYTINAFNSNCANSMNGVAVITINPLPIAYTVTGGGAYCSGSGGVAVGLSNSQTGTRYQLTLGGSPVGSPVNGSTGNAISFGNQTAAGTYTVTATTTSTSCTQLMTNSAVVTVNPTPTASISASSLSSCEGTGVVVTVSGTPGTEVSYSLNGIAQSPNITIPSSGNMSFNTPTDAGTYNYTITGLQLGSCSGSTGSTTGDIVINPLPLVAAISGSEYVAIGRDVQLSESTTGGVWAISNSDYATLSSTTDNPVTVHGVSAAGTPVVTYTVTNAATGCSNSSSLTLHVYDPSLVFYITAQDGNSDEPSTWLVNTGDGNLVPADAPPSNTDNITVRHNIIMTQNYSGSSTASFVMTGGSITILPNQYFSTAGGADFGGFPVIIKSDATGTGAIGAITNSENRIANATNVTVERYVPAENNRAWRLITSPIVDKTINETWQEGQLWDGTGGTPPSTGYGTLITGVAQRTAANANAHGFDFWDAIASNNTSIRAYTPGAATGSWRPLESISGVNVMSESNPAWMLFVRGDRNVTTGSGNTTLRATGELNQSSKTISVPGNNAYTLVGNPYASPISFEQVYSSSTGIKTQFLTWNSSLGDYGAYAAVIRNSENDYSVVPYYFNGGTSVSTPVSQYIQSGQGFFVQPETSAGGTLTITDAAKTPAQTDIINPFRENAYLDKKLYVNLHLVSNDSTSVLADGLLARFDQEYADVKEKMATIVTKESNFNENLGIESSDGILMIAAHSDIVKTDTLQLKMWNLVKRTYELQLKADRFDSVATLYAWLEDSYLNTKEPISLTGNVSTFSFTITSDSASWKTDRFRIVFQNQSAVLPVTLTSVKATPQNSGVNVQWTVSNEVNMKGYTVERSTDGGRTYAAIAEQTAKNASGAAAGSYSSFDALPQKGENLYRIRMEGKDGAVTYSSVVKVTMGEEKRDIQITIYPNPVKEGKVNLQLSNLSEGRYLVSLYSAGGQNVYNRKIAISPGSSVQSEQLITGNQLAQGSYLLKLTDSKGISVYETKLVVAK